MVDIARRLSPDRGAANLLRGAPQALRYDWSSDDPHEVAGMLHALMPAGVRVLDIGCGTGSVTLAVNRDKGNEVWGIEPDPDRAALAGARGIKVHCGVLAPEFVGSHAPFDAVMLADVIEHVAAPGELLALAASAVRDGGTVLLSVPNVAHWTVRLNLLRGRFDYTETGILDATHLRWFTEKTIRSVCGECGLDVLSVRHTAGNDLTEYGSTYPWKAIPARARRPLVRQLARALPRLFGCQRIVEARKPAGRASR